MAKSKIPHYPEATPPARGPSNKGAMMRDYPKGQPRVRGWPTNYKRTPTAAQKEWQDWFQWTIRAFKYLPASIQVMLREATQGTPFMPSDFFVAAQAGTLFYIQHPNGNIMTTQAPKNEVSASLDVLGNPRGAILYRGSGLWTPLQPGTAGKFLRSNGPGADPTYETPSGAGFWDTIANGSISSSILEATSLDLTGYDLLKIRCVGVKISTNPKYMYLQFHQNGSWQTSGYQRHLRCQRSGGSILGYASSSSAGGFIVPVDTNYDVGGLSAQNFMLEGEMGSPGLDSEVKQMKFTGAWLRNNGEAVASWGSFRSASGSPITGIRLRSWSTDDIIAGQMLIQGATF